MEDIFADEHYRVREDIVYINDPVFGDIAMPAPVPVMSETPGKVNLPSPTVGMNNQEILGDLLGLTADDIDELYR